MVLGELHRYRSEFHHGHQYHGYWYWYGEQQSHFGPYYPNDSRFELFNPDKNHTAAC